MNPVQRALIWISGVTAFLSFLLLFHNFGLSLLPDRQIVFSVGAIQPLDEGKAPGYVFPFEGSDADRPQNMRSRVRLLEDGLAIGPKRILGPLMGPVSDGRWLHPPGYIIFSASDNSDPRVNGHTYTLLYPPFYSTETGWLAIALFCTAILGLRLLTRAEASPIARSSTKDSRWSWHVAGGSLLFLAGLYCNTGTLAPYANTFYPLIDPTTGALYNFDHHIFRVLYDFVNGADRSLWDNAILLRRILFPVLAWPFMRLAGFETGGVIASLVFNYAGFLTSLQFIRRRVGERGAVFALWLLALYPGASYWAGLPYTYTLIFPCSLLLMIGLMDLCSSQPWRKLFLISIAMGFAYLAYDLALFFIPASLLALASQRRWKHGVTTFILQSAPTVLWLIILHLIFRQTLRNSNSDSLAIIVRSYLSPGSFNQWWNIVCHTPDIGGDIFFGANFLFLPALFLIVLALNPVTSRIHFTRPEISLLAVGMGMFLFSNLAPPFESQWCLRGSWIARLYQPVFPALVIFLSRWWQHLPKINKRKSILIYAAIAGASMGNALIIFGPILKNPWHISEEAFYRFYTHTDQTWNRPYEHNLEKYGRRPLGFPATPLP